MKVNCNELAKGGRTRIDPPKCSLQASTAAVFSYSFFLSRCNSQIKKGGTARWMYPGAPCADSYSGCHTSPLSEGTRYIRIEYKCCSSVHTDYPSGSDQGWAEADWGSLARLGGRWRQFGRQLQPVLQPTPLHEPEHPPTPPAVLTFPIIFLPPGSAQPIFGPSGVPQRGTSDHPGREPPSSRPGTILLTKD